ncbi:class I tRNA ligase family protein [Patescibacteria group bacterium]|nr:class I tRNA ligase family protein [Patescibacteria group bacterium]MBU1757946.1 class I tRNA ligase family protein [Patescibacteria group bacterium]
MLTRIKQLYQELDTAMMTNMIPEFGKKLVDVISYDFCRKYIEISKYSDSVLTEKVMMFAAGKILQLLSLYAPFVSEKLWILM